MGDVDGFAAPEFEGVKQEFSRQINAYPAATGAAVAVCVKGTPVVDLWAGQSRPGSNWRESTACVVFSVTKGMATFAMQHLVSRGLLELDEPVARYWPAFAASGKSRVTVRDVLTHRSGLPFWDDYQSTVHAQSPVQIWRDADKIIDVMAQAPQVPGYAGEFHYHALTLGWLLDGIVRATVGCSLGTYFADEVAGPLDLNIHVGLPASTSADVAQLMPMAPAPGSTQPLAPLPAEVLKSLLVSPTGVNFLDNVALINSAEFHEIEQAGVNGIADARSLARAYGVLAGDGHWGARQVIDQATVKAFAEPQLTFSDTTTGERKTQSVGYLGNLPLPLDGWGTAHGHTGAGGSIAWADPQAGISFAFVTNWLQSGDDRRAAHLAQAVRSSLA